MHKLALAIALALLLAGCSAPGAPSPTTTATLPDYELQVIKAAVLDRGGCRQLGGFLASVTYNLTSHTTTSPTVWMAVELTDSTIAYAREMAPHLEPGGYIRDTEQLRVPCDLEPCKSMAYWLAFQITGDDRHQWRELARAPMPTQLGYC